MPGGLSVPGLVDRESTRWSVRSSPLRGRSRASFQLRCRAAVQACLVTAPAQVGLVESTEDR